MNNATTSPIRDAAASSVDEPFEPIACDLAAIPAAERAGHMALARELFGDEANVRQLQDGVEVSLSTDRLRDAVAFIENERRCCRHLGFSLTVAPQSATFILRVHGPWMSLQA